MSDFRYFAAPRSEMANVLAGDRRCDFCGTTGPCFSLAASIEPPAGREAGCFACLRAGRFGFSHITEVGYLEAQGLVNYDEPEEPRRLFVVGSGGDAEVLPGGARPVPGPAVPPPDAIEELRRTPDFPTWNEVPWPVHCADFMTFLGPWQPADVLAAASGRGVSAEDLFPEMGGGKPLLPTEEWGVPFFVFRCTACQNLRGWFDPD